MLVRRRFRAGRHVRSAGIAALAAVVVTACSSAPTVDEAGEQLAGDGAAILEWADDMAIGEGEILENATNDLPCDDGDLRRELHAWVVLPEDNRFLSGDDDDALDAALNDLGTMFTAAVAGLGYDFQGVGDDADDLVERRRDFVKESPPLRVTVVLYGGGGAPHVDVLGATECLSP